MNKENRRTPLKVIQPVLGTQLPPPIPEPPRVINTRPFVPDLSLSLQSSHSSNEWRTVKSQQQFASRARPPNDHCTHFPLKNVEELVENVALNAHKPYRNISTNHKFKTIYPPSVHAFETANDFTPIIRNKENSMKVKQSHIRSTPSNTAKCESERKNSDDDIHRMLREQDEKLKRISQQIERLLKLQDIVTKKPTRETRSVETMTSVIMPEVSNTNEKEKKIRMASKQRDYTQMQIIREGQSDESLESQRGETSNNRYTEFYDKILLNISDNINEVLKNSESSACESDSFESRYIPPSRSRKAKKNVNSCENRQPSEQTLIINALVSKYLYEEKREARKPRVKRKQNNIYTGKYEYKSCGVIEQSLATRNYLEKYGLINDFKTTHHYKDDVKKGVILDLPKLKNQPKLE